MKRERNMNRGKRFKETKNERKEKQSKQSKKFKINKNKIVKILKYILLIILIPISFILDFILFILKNLFKLLKLVIKFTKKHYKIITRIIIISIIIFTGIAFYINFNNSMNNLNTKLNDLNEKQIKLEENFNLKTEEYNKEIENKNKEIENKDKELQEKNNEITKLQKQVTSRGSLSSRSSTVKTTNTTVATGSKAEYQSYAKDLCINTYGWTENDFNCLVKLWEKESNWNPNAHNKSSGAHGICQSLPASKMASEGADYYTNGKTQIRWGLKYIKNRYGNPANAWAHSVSHNWY